MFTPVCPQKGHGIGSMFICFPLLQYPAAQPGAHAGLPCYTPAAPPYELLW